MECKFCSQWNPQGATRCCFCDNQPGAEADASASGRPPYETRSRAAVIKALPSSYDLPKPTTRPPVQFEISLTPNQAIAAGVVALLLILGVLSRC